LRSESLAVVQLILLYHLLRARQLQAPELEAVPGAKAGV
jgi:hypothetical protein